MTSTITVAERRETLDDLMRYDGNAELIGGKVVKYMPTGRQHADISLRIAMELKGCTRSHGGSAYSDNIGYAVPELPSGRESFSPDASYFAGPHLGKKEDFIVGPPTFAVEIRSKCDYGPSAEDQMERKREDYFEAGTKAVWDIDPEAETVRLFLSDTPGAPITFRTGELAHAGPVLPGWTMPVAEIFAE